MPQSIQALAHGREFLSSISASKNKILCVDAFPRSGNTFTTYLSALIIYSQSSSDFDFDFIRRGFDPRTKFQDVLSTEVINTSFVHHQHDPSLTRQLIENGFNVLTIIREPSAALSSLLRYYRSQPDAARANALTYLSWLDLADEMSKQPNFKPLLFTDICTRPGIVADALFEMGLVSEYPEEDYIPFFEEYTKSMIRFVDRSQHGNAYVDRCSVPIDRHVTSEPDASTLKGIDINYLVSRFADTSERIKR